VSVIRTHSVVTFCIQFLCSLQFNGIAWLLLLIEEVAE
jgi:hypothetical protein